MNDINIGTYVTGSSALLTSELSPSVSYRQEKDVAHNTEQLTPTHELSYLKHTGTQTIVLVMSGGRISSRKFTKHALIMTKHS